jgi:hypothetical protein
MKYQIQKLDGRYSYNQHFKYYIGFPARMSFNQGPADFTQALKWFFATYGWSAEIRNWMDILQWHSTSVPLMMVRGGFARPMPKHMPEECNELWSWSNGYDDLRIYVKSDAELSFFQLAHPNLK